MTAKAIEGKELAAVLARMRALLETKFERNQTRLAQALGVTGTAVSDILSGTKGPGLKVLIALAREAGITLDELLGLPSSPRETWSSTPQWPDVVKEARAMFPKVSEATWTALGRLSGVAPPALEPAAIGSLAVAWDQHAKSAIVSPRTDRAPKKHDAKGAAKKTRAA